MKHLLKRLLRTPFMMTESRYPNKCAIRKTIKKNKEEERKKNSNRPDNSKENPLYTLKKKEELTEHLVLVLK